MQHMKRKVVRPSDSDRQVKSGQFRRKSIKRIKHSALASLLTSGYEMVMATYAKLLVCSVCT
jgi:hypothetical protein